MIDRLIKRYTDRKIEKYTYLKIDGSEKERQKNIDKEWKKDIHIKKDRWDIEKERNRERMIVRYRDRKFI